MDFLNILMSRYKNPGVSKNILPNQGSREKKPEACLLTRATGIFP